MKEKPDWAERIQRGRRKAREEERERILKLLENLLDLESSKTYQTIRSDLLKQTINLIKEDVK